MNISKGMKVLLYIPNCLATVVQHLDQYKLWEVQIERYFVNKPTSPIWCVGSTIWRSPDQMIPIPSGATEDQIEALLSLLGGK